MSIASDLIRGNTDMLILAHLCRQDSYGYQINKTLQDKSDGQLELKEATLYGAFRRLEDAGFIESYWGDEQTGARRRYYHITDTGRLAFAESRKDWRRARDIIDTLIAEEEVK